MYQTTSPVFPNIWHFFCVCACVRVTFPGLDISCWSSFLSENQTLAWLWYAPSRYFHTTHRSRQNQGCASWRKIAPVSSMFFKQLVPSCVNMPWQPVFLPHLQHLRQGSWTANSSYLLIAQAFSDDVEEVVLLIPQVEVVHTTSPTPQPHSSFKKSPTRLWTKK